MKHHLSTEIFDLCQIFSSQLLCYLLAKLVKIEDLEILKKEATLNYSMTRTTHTAPVGQGQRRENMNLVDVTRLSYGPVLNVINWLQWQNLISNPLRCVPCNQQMELAERNKIR